MVAVLTRGRASSIVRIGQAPHRERHHRSRRLYQHHRRSGFDDTLKTALNVSLRQSPFLNVLSDNEVATTLQLMTRPAEHETTPDVARELCQRAGSKAYVAGSIASLGSQYVLGLKAVNCQNGDLLAQEQVTAAAKEKVLDALGKAGIQVAQRIGRVARYGAEVRCSAGRGDHIFARSPESVQPWRKGISRERPLPQPCLTINVPSNSIRTLPWAIRAVGNDYYNLDELGRASEYFTKAFQLREHASEREKLTISADYYSNVTGELDKAAQTFQECDCRPTRESSAPTSIWATSTPRRGNMRKAAEPIAGSLRLAPDDVAPYDNLANAPACLAALR